MHLKYEYSHPIKNEIWKGETMQMRDLHREEYHRVMTHNQYNLTCRGNPCAGHTVMW